MIYSYNKSQHDALFLKFILIKYSTCFGQIYCPKHVEYFIKINLRNSASVGFYYKNVKEYAMKVEGWAQH
jgi:hypothetical protein